MTLLSKKPLMRVLAGETLTPPPVWLMRQAGRYLPEYRKVRERAGGFLDLCFTPELAAEVTLQPVRRFDFDAAILFADILLVAQALGRRLQFEDGYGPILEPLRADEIERLEVESVVERLAPVFATVRQVKAALPARVALIGFAGAPWTVASYMIEGGGSREFRKARRWIRTMPEQFAALVDRLIVATVDYLDAQIAAGAEAVQLFDSWAGVLPPAELLRWSLVPTAAIVARLKTRHPEVPVILFPRGASRLYGEFAAGAGADALGLDSSVELEFARRLQVQIPIQGNLDPATLVAGGAALSRGIDRILEALGHGPLIFNLGHGVVPQTPPEHVASLVELVRRWRP